MCWLAFDAVTVEAVPLGRSRAKRADYPVPLIPSILFASLIPFMRNLDGAVMCLTGCKRNKVPGIQPNSRVIWSIWHLPNVFVEAHIKTDWVLAHWLFGCS